MRKVLVFLLSSILLFSCWGNESQNEINDLKTDIIEENNEVKEIPTVWIIEKWDTADKKLEISVISVETIKEYKSDFDDLKSEWIQKVTLKLKNIWKEPYNVNSGVWVTEWWIQLQNNWYKYNVATLESIDNLNPWKDWEMFYLFDTWLSELQEWATLIFNKTNLKEELELKLK